jgi:hypothetical protein
VSRDHGPIVLDTGPLLMYLALDYLEGANKARRDKIFRSIHRNVSFDETRQEHFKVMLQARSSILTSSLVIAEALKLRGNTDLKAEQEQFRHASLKKLQGSVTEISVTLATLMSEDGFSEPVVNFGLTDASTLWLGHTHECDVCTGEEKPTLFGAYSLSGAKFRLLNIDRMLEF